jgi:catechol 2,3-dioxygenase-like lactoylglutathione lyase family enzyme
MVSGIHHTGITVSDMDRSIVFYERVLGAEVLWRRPGIASDYARVVVGVPDAVMSGALLSVPGGGCLELVEYEHPAGEHIRARPCDVASSHVAVVVDDLAAQYRLLTESGCELISGPECLEGATSTGGRTAYARDPDGALLEFMQL